MAEVEKVDRGVFAAEQVGTLLSVAPIDWRTDPVLHGRHSQVIEEGSG